ncbi:hypothetical protein [Streptococcus uberis]
MKTTYKVTSTVATFSPDCARWIAAVCKAQAASEQAFLLHGFNSCVLNGLKSDGGNLTLTTSGKGDKLSLNLRKSDVFKVAAVSPLERQFALMVKLTELNLEFGTNVQMPILEGVRLAKREKK